MKIYVDFDDVLCETADAFTLLVKEMFGIDRPYEEVRYFDLKKAFGLNDAQYELMMTAGHRPEWLLKLRETPDASRVIRAWLKKGHEVAVITGRPYRAYEPSRAWLDNHGLGDAYLFCVDKYGREKAGSVGLHGLTLEELYGLPFDFAVEDSPAAFEHVRHFYGCTVAVFDRPWNREAPLPEKNFLRCKDWNAVDQALKNAEKQSPSFRSSK